jgi:hypothetical protein
MEGPIKSTCEQLQKLHRKSQKEKGGRKMNWINCQAFMRAVVISAVLPICGYFVQPSFAGEGDSPLEAYFLPHNTELSGTVASEFTSDYYKVIVPTTGRLIITLYDISLNDNADGLNISLIRKTKNSIGIEYPDYWNYIAESTNDSMTPEIIDMPNVSRGIYFVQVEPQKSFYGWDGASYKIKADFTAFPPVVSDDIGDQKLYALPIVNQLPTICTLSGNNDVDYFECHMPYNTNLTVGLNNISAGGNVYVEVYTAWDVMIGSDTQAGNTDKVLYLPDLVPGQYFIKIFGDGAPMYTFTATQEFAKATDIQDDVGNDLAHSMPIMPGNPSVFCLQPYDTDIDVFSVYQTEDGPITIDVYNILLWDNGDGLYLQLLDEYGNVLAQSDNEVLTPEHIELNISRGQYFIAIYGRKSFYGFDGAIYTIDVETSAIDVGDTFNQAMQIHAVPYGNETYGYPYIGMIDKAGDTDFFQVVLKDSGFIYLEIDRMLHSNVDVQLFDAYHNLLQTSANPDTQSEMIYVDALDTGVYFFKVYSPKDGTGQYRLTPTISTPTSPISDDIGDDMSRAFPLIPYRRINGYIWNDNTSDYFKFRLETANDTVQVHVNNQHVWDVVGDDIMLYVYDSTGSQIGSSDNDVLEDEIVELGDLDAGTYYARVAPQRSFYGMDPVQYCIMVETDIAPLPSAELSISADVQGKPGEIVCVPVVLSNIPPVEVSSVSIGVQFDPSILEPLGVSNAGSTLQQWDAQVRYARSVNTISVSMNNFSTAQSGELLSLIFEISPSASFGNVSVLTVLTATLNGALVPGTDGLITVINGTP